MQTETKMNTQSLLCGHCVTAQQLKVGWAEWILNLQKSSMLAIVRLLSHWAPSFILYLMLYFRVLKTKPHNEIWLWAFKIWCLRKKFAHNLSYLWTETQAALEKLHFLNIILKLQVKVKEDLEKTCLWRVNFCMPKMSIHCLPVRQSGRWKL